MTVPGKEGLRVLVVDDSAVVREALRTLFLNAPDIGAVETAADGKSALRKLVRFKPDVITLDVEMPDIDGLTTLKRIMATLPRPVVMVSAFTSQGARRTIRALELGALDFIQKPGGAGSRDISEVSVEIVEKVVALGKNAPRRLRGERPVTAPAEEEAARPHLRKRPRSGSTGAASVLVAIGASTGGTEAIRHIITRLPANFPAAVVVTQHMPEGFTQAFANRLDELCEVEVKEAAHHDLLLPGRVLIAPGNFHLLVHRERDAAFVTLTKEPAVNGHRPSVDVMFDSVAATYGPSAVAALLTGMGKDGAAGLLGIRQQGGMTVAESEHSCVVFGMPKVAIGLGAAAHVTPLQDIPALIQRVVMMRLAKGRG